MYLQGRRRRSDGGGDGAMRENHTDEGRELNRFTSASSVRRAGRGKCDLCDSERGMETADPSGFGSFWSLHVVLRIKFYVSQKQNKHTK